MINSKKSIGIIPARSGSKGLPGKNTKLLCGKPLIAWSIEKALRSKYLDTVMVTTDCPEIARVAKEYGAEVPFLRPPELATDTASSYDVIRHTLLYYSEQKKVDFDYTVLLEPTSPLREDDDIDSALLILDDASNDFDSIVSIGMIGEHPSIMKRIVGKTIEPYCKELIQTTRRQDNIPAYFPYGVAYISKTTNLLNENTFYTKRCTGYPIQRYQNYEIDDIYDFFCVEAIMKKEWNV